MFTPDSATLAKKWIALGLPWMPGMRLDSPDGWQRLCEDTLNKWEGWPDLTDPATLGCLLHQVREVCGDSTIYVEFDQEWSVFGTSPPDFYGRGATEAEALIAALETAKERGLI